MNGANERNAIQIHVDEQPSIETSAFSNINEFVQHALHKFPYEIAASLAKGHDVLDLGCNVGYGTYAVSKKAKSVVGIDVSEKVINEAKERYQSENLLFSSFDGIKLPFGDESFDLVISLQVIEHIENCERYLLEVSRVLKRDGIFFATTPNAMLRLDIGMKPWYKFHVREYRPDELQALISPYFTSTEILGLHATSSLYSVEYDRVTSIRNSHRGKNTKDRIKSAIKSSMPDFITKNIRRLRSKKKKTVHGEGDLYFGMRNERMYYLREQLDQALDLLAVCGKDRSPLSACIPQALKSATVFEVVQNKPTPNSAA